MGAGYQCQSNATRWARGRRFPLDPPPQNLRRDDAVMQNATPGLDQSPITNHLSLITDYRRPPLSLIATMTDDLP
jgi:hypothetical protein